MTKQLTVAGQICTTLDKMGGSFTEALAGTGVSVSRFLATAKTAVQTHTDQKGLESADRNSLYLAIKKAAGDGLLPDNRESALVIYNTKQKDGTWSKQVQYQPMVQGLVKLARKSGEIEKLGAFIVYDKDSFRFEVGHDEIPHHSAPEDENGNHLWFSDRGKPIGVWAFVKLKSGEYLDPIMLTQERINRIATRSKVPGNYDPTGKTKDKYGNVLGKDWEEWWKKAAIRNILKYAPKSTSLDQAMNQMDNEFEFERSQAAEDQGEPSNPINSKPKTESKAAAAVKAKAASKAQEEEYSAPDDDGVVKDIDFEEVPPIDDEDIPI